MNPISDPTNEPLGSQLTVRLPTSVLTFSGIAFNPNHELWNWVDGTFTVYLSFWGIGCSVEVTNSLKHTLSVFAKGGSARHFSNLFRAFKHFLSLRDRKQLLEQITLQEVSDYGARLHSHEKYRLGTLKVLLKKWGSLGLGGLDNACLSYLAEKRIGGNKKGDAVRMRDPIVGPYSESEYTSLYKRIDSAHGTGELPLWATILARLHFVCGGRISQFASMKVKDVVLTGSIVSFGLPQAKTREIHSRKSFVKFDLSPQTGRMLLEYVERLKANGGGPETALFTEVLVKGVDSERRSDGDLFAGHCTSDDLSRVFNTLVRPIAPPSDRLDFAPTPVTSKRWRSTLGTRMAEEGASRVVIASTLGHADLQNVNVYFEASPIVIENIDKAMGQYLAPLAEVFTGRVVDDEAHSTPRGALGSRIIDFRVSKNPLGSCKGLGKGCGFDKPVACYTCFRFEPWLDAPHEKVLHRLREERQRHAGDERIAGVNDVQIKAVEEVIAECAQVREQRAEQLAK